jgi:outer membrane immunogenic protein
VDHIVRANRKKTHRTPYEIISRVAVSMRQAKHAKGGTMRFLAFITATALLAPGTVSAADLLRPGPKPIRPDTTADWNGFYFGANFGRPIGSTQTDFPISNGLVLHPPSVGMSGVSGGIQAGYNWQANALLLGLETDFQGTNARSSLQTPCVAGICAIPASAQYDQRISWFGTVRARAGYAFDRAVIYATGGFAYAQIATDAYAAAATSTAALSRSRIVGGWTVGGGIEAMLASNWTGKVEYLFAGLDRIDGTMGTLGPVTIGDRSRINLNIIRAGVNYRF